MEKIEIKNPVAQKKRITGPESVLREVYQTRSSAVSCRQPIFFQKYLNRIIGLACVNLSLEITLFNFIYHIDRET